MRIPHWEYLSWARDRFGFAAAVAGYPQVWATGFCSVPAGRDSQHNVYLRTESSDLTVWNEVFQAGEYDVEVDDPKLIIDAGAHIGLASVYFAQRYPRAKVVAVELDRRNFGLLVHNCAPFPNITPLHAGIWSHSTRLKVANPDAANWSYRAEEGGDIKALTVNELLDVFGFERVDLFKIDIEGGEKPLLEHAAPWIDKVGTMAIELHDRHVPGCTDALKAAIAGRKVTHSVSGSKGTTVLRFG